MALCIVGCIIGTAVSTIVGVAVGTIWTVSTIVGAAIGIIADGSNSGGTMGNNSCCSSTMGNATGAGAGSLTRVALFDFFFFFLPPMQAASPPPQSASRQHKAKIPRRIQSHRRLLDEFSVVVVTAVVCTPWVVCGMPVVPGAAPPVVVPLPIIAPATAKAAAPAITPPTTAFFPGPGGDGPGARVVSHGLSE